MNNFITFREGDKDELKYYILQREFPHIIGKIDNYPNRKSLSNYPVAGYGLFINFETTLSGGIPSYKNILEEINIVVSQMAIWFLVNRINGNERKYEKFKI